jgi:omega-amidase
VLRASAITACVPPPLTASCFAFEASSDVRRNAQAIAAAIREASAAGSQIVVTPECALTGYPGCSRRDLEEVDWRAVASLEDHLAEIAGECQVVLILGSASLGSDGITNDALVCGTVPYEQRYHKRSLTPNDREFFVPGFDGIVFEILGWRIGLSICYDVRFPTVWADLGMGMADCFINLAHMAGQDVDPGCKAEVVPAHYATRAAEWATPLLLCNTAAQDRWLDSALWDPRGLRVANRGEGLLQVHHPVRIERGARVAQFVLAAASHDDVYDGAYQGERTG